MYDLMIQTEEHQSLEHDSKGEQKCVMQNGWEDFYACYYRTLASNLKYKCQMPFSFGQQQNTSSDDAPRRNCTKYVEGYEFFQ